MYIGLKLVGILPVYVFLTFDNIYFEGEYWPTWYLNKNNSITIFFNW